MGCLYSIFGRKNKEETKQTSKPEGNDLVILRIKRSRDKIKSKRNGLETNVKKITEKVISLKKENNKESAMYYLGKRRVLQENLKNIDNKLSFLEDRINKIEEMLDDVEFTNTLKESNVLIKELMENVDLDAIREAGDLDKEINFNNEEIQNLIQENMHDDELLDEFENLGNNKKIIQEKKIIEKKDNTLDDTVNEPLLA